MAFGDPTNPATPTAAQPSALDTLTQEQYSGNAAGAKMVAETLEQLHEQIAKTPGFIDRVTESMNSNSVAMAAGSAVLFGAEKAFRSFGGSIDDSRVNGFTDQFNKLLEVVKTSPVGSVAATTAMDGLHSMMSSAGASGSTLTGIMGKLATGSVDAAKAFLTGADNMLHMQNAMVMSSAAGGTMTDFLRQAGADLENLNDMTLKAAQVQNTSRGATGMSREEMQKYLGVMTEIPGALLHMGDATEIGGVKTSLLTAAIQYADGAGRKHADVIKDISDGMVEYGMSMEGGLKYSARMSEVSETLGARTGDVGAAMKNASDNFKSYIRSGEDASNMNENQSKAMEEYVSKLQSTGLPTKQAIDMYKNYTDQMSHMTLGQEAFLSQQSGGPGGMMGAFQMEDLIAKDPKAAMKKVKEAIEKITGPLVTKEAAKHDQAAADKYAMQAKMVEQGPLGSWAKGGGQRDALMESMRTGKSMPHEKGRTFEDTVKTGQELEQTSMTQVQQMDVKAESVQIMGAKAALDVTQNILGARSGSRSGVDGTGAGVNTTGQEQLRSQQNIAGATLPGHEVPALMDVKNYLSTLPAGLKAAGKAAMESFTGNNQATPQQIKDAVVVGIQNQALRSANKSDTETAQKVAQHLSAGASTVTSSLGMGGTKTFQPKGSDYYNAESVNAASQVGKTINAGTGPMTAGGHVGQAIPAPTQPPATTGGTAATATAAHAAGGMGGGQTGPVPVTLVGSTLTVNFTGKCPHCGSQVHTSEHATVNNAASTR
jgi:hypothetical protein